MELSIIAFLYCANNLWADNGESQLSWPVIIWDQYCWLSMGMREVQRGLCLPNLDFNHPRETAVDHSAER